MFILITYITCFAIYLATQQCINFYFEGIFHHLWPKTKVAVFSGHPVCTGCPKKMYHICFAHSFHTFLRNLLKHTSKDSQIHGDLLTPPPASVTCPWRSRCHVLEVGVPEKCTTFKSGISQKLCTWYVWFWCHPIAHFMEFLCLARAHYLPWSSWA